MTSLLALTSSLNVSPHIIPNNKICVLISDHVIMNFFLFGGIALYEYKERLENSFVDLKEKKSTMSSQSESLKSELSVLKQSHRTEMQRLQV